MASPSGISIKGIGLIAAGALAVLFTVIIVVSAMMNPTSTAPDNDEFFADPEEIPDIEQTQTGGAMFVTIVDKNDPTRISSTLQAARFEPIGEGRRRLDEPESWIYLKDGKALRVNADFATMLMPDPNEAPESGTLEGNIVIRAYDTTPAPGAPAPDDQPPTLTASFDEPLEFERRYLRMRSPGHFEIESNQVDFAGTDLTVIFNDLRNRIELIDVMQGDQIVIHTQQFEQDESQPEPQTQQTNQALATPPAATPSVAATPATTQAEQQPQSDDTPTTEPQPDAPSINHYRIALESDVAASLNQAGQLNAELMQIWATIVDGQLPEDAIRQLSIAQAPQQSPDTAALSQSSETTETSEQDTSTTLPPTSDSSTTPTQTASAEPAPRDLVITWSGPLRVRPLDETPTLLSDDHLALHLESTEDTSVTMDAPSRGFTGQARTITYFATRAIAKLVGEQTESGIVKLDVENAGTLFAESLTANLATGQVDLNQRGSISTKDSDPTQIASIRWKNKAAIKFAIDENGALTQRLENAFFSGAAIAEQNGSSIGARQINVELDPTLPPNSALTKLVLNEGVISSAQKQTLTGQTVTIDFVPDPTGASPPQPVRVSSVGSSMGRTPDARLRALEMHARLTQDATGKTLIQTASAKGEVMYLDAQRTTAQAHELQADVQSEIITLTGPDTQVTQAGSTIAGDHITLRAQRRAIEVLGHGSFDHDIALSQSEDATPGLEGHINARWAESMRFEDTLGTIECDGDVRVISTPDALTRDTLKADRITINLTPMPTSDPVAGQKAPERQFISARAAGRAEPGAEPIPASIESRTYSAQDPELALGVLYLEGAQILANNQNQTLTVPGKGTLLILDREQDETAQQSDQPITGSGLTRFNWASRMVLDRSIGQGTFTGSVAVDHKSLTSSKVAKLSTDSLVANFNVDQSKTDNANPIETSTGTLRSAIAQGNVRFIYDARELLSDRAEYDAIEESLFADAIDNKLVTLYDDNNPAPMSARSLLWDLKRDRYEINAPSPVRTVPGG